MSLLQFFQYLVPFRSRSKFLMFLSSENNFPFFWYGFPDLLAKLSVYFATWYDVSVVGGQSFPMLQNLHGLRCIVMYDPLTMVVPFSGPEVSEHHVNGQFCPRLIIYRRRYFEFFLPSFFFLVALENHIPLPLGFCCASLCPRPVNMSETRSSFFFIYVRILDHTRTSRQSFADII